MNLVNLSMNAEIAACSGNYSCKSDAILAAWRVLNGYGYSFKDGDYTIGNEWYKDSGRAVRAYYSCRSVPGELTGSACYGERIGYIHFNWYYRGKDSYDFEISA